MANTHISITVDGMTDDSIEKINKALERINGVEKVMVNLENKKVIIEYDEEKINERLIKETIEDEGFKVR